MLRHQLASTLCMTYYIVTQLGILLFVTSAVQPIHLVWGVTIHCKTNPVKLTVKLLAAVLPTKNRKIYGQENDNRYFFTGNKP